MLKCLLKTLTLWDWVWQKKATQPSAHSWESFWGVVSTKQKIIAAKVLFYSKLFCQDSTWMYLKTCGGWVLCDRFLGEHEHEHEQGFDTVYYRIYLEFSWPSSWTFIPLPSSSPGPWCYPDNLAVITSFDKILKPGEKKGRQRICFLAPPAQRMQLTMRSGHRVRTSKRRTCSPNRTFFLCFLSTE